MYTVHIFQRSDSSHRSQKISDRIILSEAKIVIKNACLTTYMHDGVHRPPSQLTSNSVSYETVLYDQSKHLSAIKNRKLCGTALAKIGELCGEVWRNL